MKRCGSCQRLVPGRYQYCPSCGARFPDAAAQSREDDLDTQLFDFRDFQLPEEREEQASRKPRMSESSLRLLLCVLAALFVIAAITFAVLLLKTPASPAPANEYAETGEAAHVIVETEDSQIPGAEPAPVQTPYQAPSSAPVQTPGRSDSVPVTTPYPAVTPAPLPRS